MEIVINVDRAVEDLRRAHKKMAADEFAKAVKMALNDGAKHGRTELAKIIRREYVDQAFTSSAVKRGLVVTRATTSYLVAKIMVQGGPIPMQYFGPRQTPKGISVEIRKGKRLTLKGAFRVKGQRGGPVFAKAEQSQAYEGGRFMFRDIRIEKRGPDTPLGKLLSISLPVAVMAEDNGPLAEVSAELSTYIPKRLEHLLEQTARGTFDTPATPR